MVQVAEETFLILTFNSHHLRAVALSFALNMFQNLVVRAEFLLVFCENPVYSVNGGICDEFLKLWVNQEL